MYFFWTKSWKKINMKGGSGMETEKKTPNQKLDVTIDISFRFTNDGIVIESSKIESGNVDIGEVPIIDSQKQLNLSQS